MKTPTRISVLALATVFFAGCSDEGDVAAKSDKELQDIVASANAKCHSISVVTEKQRCLQTVKTSPEVAELLERRNSQDTPFQSEPVGRTQNTLDW
jgi:PBP1b-binding outer membrane lipoprotein LpoB